jgi:pimeloyl-ACP methyl ester carboxylesterase
MDLRPSSRVVAPGVPASTRRLVTRDGVSLSAAFDAPTAGRADLAFLMVHGFTGSWARADNRRIAAAFTGRGGVVSVDLRGHGRSAGRSTIGDAEVRDVDAAIEYAHWLGFEQVVTVGFSMGGSVVLRHAALSDAGHRPSAVVAVSSAGFWFYRGTAPMRLLHQVVHSRGGRAFLRSGYGTRVANEPWVPPYPLSPTEAARRIAPTPLLVVHGDRDAFFPTEHAEAVVAAAHEGASERGVPDRASYWLEHGFAHAESATSPELADRIAQWAAHAVHEGASHGASRPDAS